MGKYLLILILMFSSISSFGQTFFSKGLISNGDVIIKNSAGLAINGDTVNHMYSSGDSLIFTTKGGKKFKALVNPVDENKLNKKFGVIDSIRVSITGDSTIFFSGTDTVMIGLLNPSTDPPADCEDLHADITATNDGVLDCNNVSLFLTGSSNQADVSFQWDGSTSGNMGTSNPLTASLEETITLTVTNNTTGCETTKDFVITTDITIPLLEKFITSTNIDDEIVLGVFVTNPQSKAEYEYSWSGTGITTNAAAQSIRVNATGDFTATVTDLKNGCNDNAVVTVVSGDFETSGAAVPGSDNDILLSDGASSMKVLSGFSYSGGGLSMGDISPLITNETGFTPQLGNFNQTYLYAVYDPNNQVNFALRGSDNSNGSVAEINIYDGGVLSPYRFASDVFSIPSGLNVGNTSFETAGTIRWTGTDFEGYDGATWNSLGVGTPVVPTNDCFIMAFSDSLTELTTANGDSWDWPYNCTIDSIMIGVNKAPTGSGLSVDVKKNATSIFSVLPTIDEGETSTTTAATDYTLSTTTLDFMDDMQAIVSSVGATFGGAGIKLYIYYTKN